MPSIQHMYLGRTTLSKFLIEQLKVANERSSLAALLVDVAAAVKAIAAITARGALAEDTDRKSLDLLANETVLRYCEWNGLLAGMASEEMPEPYAIPAEYERGSYLLLFDPLHASSGLEVNSLLGTLFSVVRHIGDGEPKAADYLQTGRMQVAAGYALYGPSTMLVLTVGKGTHGFTLDRETGNFLLTHLNMHVTGECAELAINTGNERFWEPPVKRYVDECRKGSSDLRSRDFKIRWIASTVAQVHRVLIRGGVFLYPRDLKEPARPGRLRLMFEANPMAFLIEQAGGRASTGRGPILDMQPEELHQRVPAILGSSEEIERIERYHREYEDGTDRPYVSPLFNERSLYREEARP